MDGILRYKNLDKVKALGFDSIAITDHANLSGTYEFYKECIKVGLKPILGNEAYYSINHRSLKQPDDLGNSRPNYHMILLAQNQKGYKNLIKMNSKAYTEGFYYSPRIDDELIAEYNEGLIATSACFPKGTKIWTTRVTKNIQDIRIGDVVLDKNGEVQEVIDIFNPIYNGTMFIFVPRKYPFKIESTADHKFLILKGNNNFTGYGKSKIRNQIYGTKIPEWVSANKIRINDYLLVPLYPLNKKIDLSLSSPGMHFLIRNGKKQFRQTKWKFNIGSEIPWSSDLSYTIGLFLAEGSTNRGRVVTTHNIKENIYSNEVIKTWEKLGLQPKEVIYEKSNKREVVVCSVQLEEYLNRILGKGAANKHLPYFFDNLNTNDQLLMIGGLFAGDGYYRKRKVGKYNSSEFVWATISHELFHNVFTRLSKLGLDVGGYISKAKIGHKEAYYLTANGKQADYLHMLTMQKVEKLDLDIRRIYKYKDVTYLALDLKSIFKKEVINENVFCLKVKNTESFLAEGVVVHNCLGSRLSQLILKGYKEQAKQLLEHHTAIFKDRYFLELQCHADEEQTIVNSVLMEFAKELNLPLILTADAHYFAYEDKALHDKFLCISTNSKVSDKNRFNFGALDCHLGSPETMEKKRITWGLPEEAISNTLYIANMCTPDYFKGIYNRYPTFKDKPEGITSDEYLEMTVKLNWLKMNDWKLPPPEVKERIQSELKTIKQMGFSDYMLIRADTVKAAEDRGILCGAGRGSAAGSMVSYLLGITKVDPIKYGLLFSRFLNEGRGQIPLIFDN